jgi:dimethylamine/trimethylamine dehydrogenase
MVTARRPNDGLYRALSERMAAGAEGAPESLRRIGDCEAPAIIAAAVYAGHRYARELDTPAQDHAHVPQDRVFDESP